MVVAPLTYRLNISCAQVVLQNVGCKGKWMSAVRWQCVCVQVFLLGPIAHYYFIIAPFRSTNLAKQISQCQDIMAFTLEGHKFNHQSNVL